MRIFCVLCSAINKSKNILQVNGVHLDRICKNAYINYS